MQTSRGTVFAVVGPLLTTLCVVCGGVAASEDARGVDGPVTDGPALLEGLGESRIVLTKAWRFSPGDDPSWAHPEYDDREWLRVDPLMADGWPVDGPRIGWFRRHVRVGDDVVGAAVGFTLVQSGASEVYFDGRLLARFGEVSSDPADETPRWTRWPGPLPVVPGAQHVLAVRYSNAGEYSWPGGQSRRGFRFTVTDLERFIEAQVGEQTRYKIKLGFAIAFVALHLALLVFRPDERSHLFFALTALGFAGLTGFGGMIDGAATIQSWRMLLRLTLVSGIVMMLSLYGVTWSFHVRKRVWLTVAMVGGALVAGLWTWFSISQLPFLLYILGATAGMALGYGGQPVEAMNEVWSRGRTILIPGFAAAGTGGLIQVASGLGWLPNVRTGSWGMLFLMLCVSLFLARHWTRTEADNARKTAELEEARDLQLSLLPVAPPKIAGLEFHFEMRTATEVGGDYYDHVSESGGNGPVVVALGDATGHGSHAGMVVMATKALFQTASADIGAGATLDRLSRTLRGMRLERRNMALVVARFTHADEVELASAGMPPAFVHRAAEALVEEVLIGAPPLGTLRTHRYDSRHVKLAPGDVLLLMSDGLGEALDASGNLLGYEALATRFGQAADLPLEDIAASVFAAASEWSGDAAPGDDQTVVLVRRIRG